MVVHPALPRMPVCIKIDGVALVEYEDRDATPEDGDNTARRVVRYVEVPPDATPSKSGSHSGLGQDERNFAFEIHAAIHGLTAASYAGVRTPVRERHQFGLAFYISVDGEEVDALLVYESMVQIHYANGKTCISKGQYIDPNTLLPFRLRLIQVVEAEAVASGRVRTAEDRERMEQLGTVKIHVWRVRKLGLAIASSGREFRHKTIDRLDEIDVKGRAISHSVGYGEAVADRGASAFTDVMPVDVENGPLAIFEFRLRSKVALQQAMIVSRTPSPSPSPETENENGDADLQRMTREQLVATISSSRKRDRGQNKTTMKIKNEIMEAAGGGMSRLPIIPKSSEKLWCIDDDGTINEEELPAKRQKIQPEPVCTLDEDDEEIGPVKDCPQGNAVDRLQLSEQQYNRDDESVELDRHHDGRET